VPDPLGPLRWYQKLGQGFAQGFGTPDYSQPQQPMSKLGKLFAILKGAGLGAAVGSTQPSFGRGLMAAQQYQDQQQNEAMQQAAQRANLQFMPLQRAWQMKQMQDQENLRQAQERWYGARSIQAEAQAARPGPLKQVGTRMVAWNPTTKAYEDVGAAAQSKPYTKVMGDRTMQWDPKTNDWNDVGEAPTKQQTPYGKIAPEVYAQLGPMPSSVGATSFRGREYESPELADVAWGQAGEDIKNRMAQARAQGFATTRGQVVTDTDTNITAPVSWAVLSQAPQGKYVSPQYDPQTQATVKAWKDLDPDGKLGTQVTSYNTFLRHTGALYDYVDELKNSGYPYWNKSVNWLRQNTGDPRVANFVTKADPVLKEFQSFLLNNRALRQDDRESAQKMITESSSPEQMYGPLASMVHTGTARLSEANNSFRRMTGQDIPDIISPEAQGAMMRVGGPGMAAEAPPQVPRPPRLGGQGRGGTTPPATPPARTPAAPQTKGPVKMSPL
jgi:hypothetical protein